MNGPSTTTVSLSITFLLIQFAFFNYLSLYINLSSVHLFIAFLLESRFILLYLSFSFYPNLCPLFFLLHPTSFPYSPRFSPPISLFHPCKLSPRQLYFSINHAYFSQFSRNSHPHIHPLILGSIITIKHCILHSIMGH